MITLFLLYYSHQHLISKKILHTKFMQIARLKLGASNKTKFIILFKTFILILAKLLYHDCTSNWAINLLKKWEVW